ncbi:GIY-YIG nuclease family protein [Massilia sp. TN1-12]|uniref:GIY-YIG nuclease family protein n=1 Tax=Massilia paldalensis TaxID=3377675 RepID=UPI00384AAF13
MSLLPMPMGSPDNSVGRQFVYMAMMIESVHLVKIGHTQNPVDREASLFTSGVQAPYFMLHAWEVEDMKWVEKQVIHPALAPFRTEYGKEIFHLFPMYPSLFDASLPDVINAHVLAGQLANDITELLQKRGILARRWTLDNLDQYHEIFHAHKNANKGR